MLDKCLLIEIINENLKARADQYSQLQEINSFNEKDDLDFNSKTEKINNLKKLIEDNEYISKNTYLTLAADFDNFKKRTIKHEYLAYDNAVSSIVLSFLRLYDDLERLVKEFRNKSEQSDDSSVDPIHSAIEMLFENFEKTLDSFNCKKIDCNIGDKFDVQTMEAICTRNNKCDKKFEIDDVVEIYQSGWKFKDKIIRPTKVIVKK